MSGWTVDGRTGFFSSSASSFTRRFRVQNTGIFYVSGNFWIKDALSSVVKVSIAVNLKFDDPNGLTARFGNTNSNGTVSLAGFLLLYENDVLSVAINGSEGTLLKFSTFSALRSSQIGTVPGFHAALSRSVEVSPSKKCLKDWRTSATEGLFQTLTGFSPSTGRFCAIIDGIYKYASNINYESAQNERNSTISLVLNKESGPLVRYYFSGAGKHTDSIDGLLHLRKGDCIELHIHSENRVLEDSSFSALYLGAKTKSIPAFSSRLGNCTQVVPSSSWQLISGWRDVSSQGYFESQSNILKNRTTFEVTVSGLYVISALLNFEISGHHTNKIFGLVTTDQPSGADGGGGLLAVTTASVGNMSIIIRGVMSLSQGENLKVYFRQEGGAPIAICYDNVFSVSLVTYDYPGVVATLNTEKRIEASDWIELTDWQTSEGYGGFPMYETSLTDGGRYQVFLDGTYFVSCNVIMKGIAYGSLEALIAVDQIVDPRNGLYYHDGNVKGNVTLNVMGSLKLRKSQNVSVFVRVEQSAPWTVRTETSFSVALIGAERLESEGVPGFFAGTVITH